MPIVDEYTRAIDAAQADRRVAAEAGEQAAQLAIFRELVEPLNRERARHLLDPKPDEVEIRNLSALMDRGLATLSAGVAPAFLGASSARADDVRAMTGGGAARRLRRPEGLPAEPPSPNLDRPEPPPEGAAGPFVSARRSAARSVVYVDAEGREVEREGGSRSWRNNNPGNIVKGLFAETNGAIGDDGTFAVFPDEASGFEAIVALLRGRSYGPLTLEGAIHRYAPPAENDTGAYVRFVSDETGLDRGVVLDDLRVADVRAIGRAIRKMEGWTPGAERPRRPVSGAPGARAAEAGAGAARPGVTTARRAAEDWMRIAKREAALPERDRSEWPDPEENPRIVEYLRTTAAWLEPSDEIDWCASFVNWCLENAGYVGTSHPGARSFFWNRSGQFIALPGPDYGCVAVRRYAPFDDPTWETGAGHVGFVVSWTDTSLRLLGGNQGKTVKEETYLRETFDAAGKLKSRFVAFMMPVMN